MGQDQELFPEITGSPQLAALLVQPTQAVQDREEFLGVPHLLTQLQSPGVGPFHLRGCCTPRGELHTQATLQREFLPGPGRGHRQRAQEGQPLREVCDRFGMGRTVYSALTSLLPIRNGLLRASGFSVVMGEPGRLMCRRRGKLLS